MLICDTNELYAAELGSYVMNHFRDVEITIFTSTESFFADEKNYDLGILTEDFVELSGFKKNGHIDIGYLLSEERDLPDKVSMRFIYRYQPINEIVSQIVELSDTCKREAGLIKESNSNFLGIYSPVNHELALPFSLSMCSNLLDKGTVLFVDLEELSIFPLLINHENDDNISDYLYYISSKHDSEKSKEYLHSYMSIDYFVPFSNPGEISEIDRKTWSLFFNEIAKLGYDNIVVLFGRTLAGFTNILESLDQLILLNKPGDYYSKSLDLFMRYIRNCRLDIPIVNMSLPMTAANLTDGTYRMDELLSGNLGVYVRKLMYEGKILLQGQVGELNACG